MIRPTSASASAGAKGESPAAMRSALTNSHRPISAGRKSRAQEVFPAPFGPASIKRFGMTHEQRQQAS